MSKNSPASPDYKGAAQQQAGASQDAVNQQTALNRPDISTPWMSQTWDPDHKHMTLGFNGAGGDIFGSLMSQFQGQLGQPLGNGDDARKAASDSIYGQETSRLDPMFGQREQSMRTQLSNQGLDPNSEAFKTEMDTFNRGRNDAYQGAMNHSISAGGEEAQRQLAMSMALRNQPLQEMLGMMGGFGQMPGFTGAGAAQAPNLFGAAQAQGQYDMSKYSADQKAGADTAGGVGQLLAALAALSDERAKQNIVRVGEALPGVPFAFWEWKDRPGSRGFGVVAQDLEKVAPHLVHARPDGLKGVDYSFLLGDRHG